MGLRVGLKQRVGHVRFALRAGLAGTVWLLACGHDARLGLQCPEDEPSCAGADSIVVSAGSGAGSGGSDPAPVAPDAAPPPAQLDAGSVPPPLADAQVPAAPSGECRSVAMAFFACASGAEQPGTPHLKAGQPYTLRLRGNYALDTTFQVMGASVACMAVPYDPLTVPADAGLAERCIRPTEDVALLVTVVSGDPQVWVQGLMAEVCDGCAE